MDLSRKFGDSFICADVTYQHTGLLAFSVCKVRSLASLCADRSDQAKRAAELEQLRKFASGAEVLRRARERKAGQAGPVGAKWSAKLRNSSKDFVAEVADSLEPEAEESSDEGLASARSEDGVGVTGSSSSSSDAGDVDAASQLVEAGASSDAFAAPPGSDADSIDLPAPKPRVDLSGRVYGPSGEYWGRVSTIRPGQQTESLSIYCSLHGCSVCKRLDRGVPSQAALLSWFEEGRKLPAGRTPALQRKHKELFPVPEA